MSLFILEPGFMTTVQDLGRPGYERLGVPISGAMDSFALMAANLLVGNPPGAAALEMAMLGPVLQAGADCLVVLTGSGFELEIQPAHSPGGSSRWKVPSWSAAFVPKGSELYLVTPGGSGWGYLGVAGGIDVPLVMGSRSTYLRGEFSGFKGRRLAAGDEIFLLPGPQSLMSLASRTLPSAMRPAYSLMPVIDMILGPQADQFLVAGLETFLGSEYSISLESDRMGYRLEGAVIGHQGKADILSEGMVFGSIQVPASGQPIVAMSDHQTAGGYTKIATVVSADLPLLAQCPLVKGRLRFKLTSVEAAQARYRALYSQLKEIIKYDDS